MLYLSQFLELFLYLDDHGQRVTIPELLQLPNGARLLPFIGRSGPGGAENGPNGPVNIPVVQANRNLNYNRPNRRMNRREAEQAIAANLFHNPRNDFLHQNERNPRR